MISKGCGGGAYLHDKVPPSFFTLRALHLVLVQLGQRLDAIQFGESLLKVFHDRVVHPASE